MSKKSKPAVKPAPARSSANVYMSVCCKAPANKPAVVMPQGKGIGSYLGAKTEGDATLGKWRCSECRKKCKVTVHPRPTQETLAV